MHTVKDNLRDELRGTIFAMRVILFSLFIAPTVYLGFELSALLGRNAPRVNVAGQQAIGYGVAIGLAAIFAGWVLVDKIISSLAKRRQLADLFPEKQSWQDQVGAVRNRYQVRFLLRAAIFEAAAYFSIYCYSITHSWANLAVSILLLMSILLCWPTTSGMVRWMEEHM